MKKHVYISSSLAIVPLALVTMHYAAVGMIAAEHELLNLYRKSTAAKYVNAIKNVGSKTKPDASFYINQAASTFLIKPALLEALIQTESNGRKDAIALNPEQKIAPMKAAAHGPMQVQGIHAGTTLCPEADTWSDLYDLRINITCGTRILRYALDNQPNLRLALAEYNGGPRCVRNQKIVCEESATHAERTLSFLAERMYDYPTK